MDTTTFFSHDLLTLARDAAFIATTRMTSWGEKLEAGYAGTSGGDSLGASFVDDKGKPNDLVTVADAEIEALVTGYLNGQRPDDVVVGEEHSASRGLEGIDEGEVIAAGLVRPARNADLGIVAPELGAPEHPAPERIEWHVDPIDGTVNFVRRIEHHCFSIGGKDLETGEWVVGLVASPVLNKVWFGVRGHGSYVAHGLPTPGVHQDYVRLSGTRPGQRGAIVATGFGPVIDSRARQVADMGRMLEVFDDIRRAGSAAIDLCQAAEGLVNGYYERGCGIYDWAGGAVVAEEAGLLVRRPVDRKHLIIAMDTQEHFDLATSIDV